MSADSHPGAPVPIPAQTRGPLTFWHADEPERSASSLSDLLATRPSSLDSMALVPRVLVREPNFLGETPYRGVRCRRRAVASRTLSPPAVPRTPVDAVRAVASALDAAVERALRGVRRVAVMTGGGLDSAGLLALATRWARRTGGSVFAVALDFASTGDDRPHLAALQAHLDAEVLRISPEDAAHALGVYRGVDASPFTWPTGAMEVEMMHRAKAHGAERVLNGAGGDQLFDGEPRSVARIARGGRLRESVRAARALRGFRRPRSPVLSWVVRPLVVSVTPLPLRRRVTKRPPVEWPSWAGSALIDWLRASEQRTFDDTYRSRRDAREHAALAKNKYDEYLFWLVHQESFATGLSSAEPYLDPVLIDAVNAIPPEWLLLGDMRRGLYREAMRGLLPESVRTRQDKAAFEPAMERFVAAARALDVLGDCASGAELARLGIVEPRAFQRAFEQFAKSTSPDSFEWVSLWPAICVEAFLEGRRA